MYWGVTSSEHQRVWRGIVSALWGQRRRLTWLIQRAARMLPWALANGLSGSRPAFQLMAKSTPSPPWVWSPASALMQLCRHRGNSVRLRRFDGPRCGDNQQNVGERWGEKDELRPSAAAHHIYAKPKEESVAWAGSSVCRRSDDRFHPVTRDPLTVWQTAQASVTMDTTSWWLLCQ